MDRLGRPRRDILAYALPGFATSDRTRTNASRLSAALGVDLTEIDITPTARLMLSELGHPFARGIPLYDITFENVQAGLRTDYLFRAANQRGGLVLGTGDLSEIALGWSTYGVGDHMSHYNVNSGIPKTLIQHLIRWVVTTNQFSDDVSHTLARVLNTVISPELIPAAPGEPPQSTQTTIGPYDLHDFFLFHALRYGFTPSKTAFIAWHAWHDPAGGDWPPGYPPSTRVAYQLPDIRQWLTVFVERFFGFSQFKRSAMPNGPKVSLGGSLSPPGETGARPRTPPPASGSTNSSAMSPPHTGNDRPAVLWERGPRAARGPARRPSLQLEDPALSRTSSHRQMLRWKDSRRVFRETPTAEHISGSDSRDLGGKVPSTMVSCTRSATRSAVPVAQCAGVSVRGSSVRPPRTTTARWMR